jgi:UDP-3-O-[3-hydroxymyristoyl] glucosamine N-acyltransferase
MSYTLSEIIAQLGGELRGADVHIERLAPLESATAGELTFIASAKFRRQLATTQASAVIASPKLADQADCALPMIVVRDPYLYFAQVATLLHPAPVARPGIDPRAVVGATSVIAASSEVCAMVSIGERVRIGERCRLFPGVVIGDDAELGDDVTLYPNVTVYHGCRIGNRSTIHSGSVIGADGFGLAWDTDHWYKIPRWIAARWRIL